MKRGRRFAGFLASTLTAILLVGIKGEISLDVKDGQGGDYFGGSENNNVNLVQLFLCCNNSQNAEEKNPHDSCFDKSEIHSFGDKRIWNVPQEFMSTSISTKFQLDIKSLNCPHHVLRTNISSIDVLNPTRNWFYPTGYLRVGKEFYAPDEFCIESITKELVNLMLCLPDCGKTRPCIPKCCTFDKIYSIGVSGERGCTPPIKQVSSTTPFNPPLYKDYNTIAYPTERTPKPHYFLHKQKDFRYNCFENRTTLFPLSERVARNLSSLFNATLHHANFRIRTDGALLYTNLVDKKCSVEFEPKKFLCFDGIQDYGEVDEAGFQNLRDEYIIHLCTKWKVEHVGSHENVGIYGVLLLCASVFPLITSGVYISLWRKQNVHGWTIAATTGSLFLMYLLQGTALVVGDLIERESVPHIWGCTLIAIVGNFSFLAAFSWMTVMCCDLWLTFRSITPNNRHSRGQPRFIKYSLFGWGLPTAFVGTGVMLDFYYAADDCTPHLVPGYGQLSCWVLPDSQGVYYYYPGALLLSLNLFFFGVTCIRLLQYRANTRFATKSDTDHWKGFSRFGKLLLVMGVTWIFEIISWSIDGLVMKWYWMIFDIINILRAVAVFVVYVCKPDILLMLEEKHPRLKKLLRPFKRKCSNDLTDATGSTVVNSPRILESDATAFQMR